MYRSKVILFCCCVAALILLGYLFNQFHRFDVVNASNEDEITDIKEDAWLSVNGLSASVYSSVSNILSSTGGVTQSQKLLLELSEKFLTLEYNHRSCEEIRNIVIRYEEVVLYLCLGLVKSGAPKADIESLIIDAYKQLYSIKSNLERKESENKSLEKESAKRVIETELKTYERFFETVGIRLVFEKFGKLAQEEFLRKWEIEKLRVSKFNTLVAPCKILVR